MEDNTMSVDESVILNKKYEQNDDIIQDKMQIAKKDLTNKDNNLFFDLFSLYTKQMIGKENKKRI